MAGWIPEEKPHTCIDKLRRMTYPEDSDYELPKLVSDYWPDRLPIIINVTVGYCGANAIDFTFSAGEMYLITHVNTQNRVILRDCASNQLLSFPEDHHLKFHTLINNIKDETPKKLSEILEEHSMTSSKLQLLPVKHETLQFFQGPGQEHSLKMDIFEWETSYEERYLVGNSIAFEKLYNVPFVIPIWMPINIEVATGIRDEPPEAFDMLMKSVIRISKRFTNGKAPGNKDVMLFEGKLSDYEGDYDTIAPSDYAAVGDVKRLDVQTYKQEPVPKPPPPLPSPRDRSDEDNGEPPPLLPRQKSQTPTHSNKKKVKALPKLPKPSEVEKQCKQDKPADEVVSPSGESLSSISSDHSSDGKKKKAKFKKLKHLFSREKNLNKSSRTGSTEKVDDDVHGSTDDSNIVSPSGESLVSQTSTQSAESDGIYEEDVFSPSGECLPSYLDCRSADHTDEEDAEEEIEDESDQEYELVVHDTPPRKPKDSSGYSKTKTTCIVSPLSKNNKAEVYSSCEMTQHSSGIGSLNEHGSRPLPALPGETPSQARSLPAPHEESPYRSRPLPSKPDETAPNTGHMLGQRPLPQTPDDVTTGGSFPSPVEKPTQNLNDASMTDKAKPATALKPPKPEQKPDSHTAASTNRPIPCEPEASTAGGYAALPRSVRGLTIQQVSECLRILKMPHHIDKFVEEDIDGNLLESFDEQCFKQDLNFTGLEAKKMMKFIKAGWVPESQKLPSNI